MHTRGVLVVLVFVALVSGLTMLLFRGFDALGLPGWSPLLFYPAAALVWAVAVDVRDWLRRRKAGGS